MRRAISYSSAVPQGQQDQMDQTHDTASLLQLSRQAQIKFCCIQARLFFLKTQTIATAWLVCIYVTETSFSSPVKGIAHKAPFIVILHGWFLPDV